MPRRSGAAGLLAKFAKAEGQSAHERTSRKGHLRRPDRRRQGGAGLGHRTWDSARGLVTETMKPLPAPDSHHLQAAQGWCELHAFAEADAELDRIATSLGTHPKVLEVRWQIYANLEKWAGAGNGGRKVRRGHVCDRAVENCGIFNNNERCTQIWKTGVRYAGGCWWKE